MANAKGSVLVGLVKFLRKRREGALEVLPPDLTHYLDDFVKLSAWYPEADFVGLVRAVARLIPGASYEEAIEGIGAAGATEHVDVYGDLLRTFYSNSSVFALWSAQHDTGELRGSLDSPNVARVRLTGFDSPSDVTCLLSMGYIRGGLTANGFEDIAIEKLMCVLRGDAYCEWRASWKNPDATPSTPARRRAR